MRIPIMMISLAGALALGACSSTQDAQLAETAPPPMPPGAVAGSMAADRNGDGIIDGYYTADGIYHANAEPAPPPPPPPPVNRMGERG
jgi:hypothetical protein